jgi:hypothetical protein
MLSLFSLAKRLRETFGRAARSNLARVRKSFKPGVEALEDRLVPARIALLGSQPASWQQDVKNKIVSTGQFTAAQIDIINIGTTTPTLATLDQYAAVLVFSDDGYADAITLGNNLAAYVNQGHGVVDAVFSIASEPLGGLWASGGYNAIATTGQTEGHELHLGTVEKPNDPIMKGVNSFDGGSSSYISTGGIVPNSGGHDSSLIASWSNGSPLVAERTGFAGKVVDLNFYPPSSTVRSDFWLANTDGAELLANSLTYAENLTPSKAAGRYN